MKKLTVLLLAFGILATQQTVNAQTITKDSTSKTHVKKVKQTTTASTMQSAKPDTATRKHKGSKVSTTTTTAATTQTPMSQTSTSKTTTTSAATTTDAKVGTDAKGRTIYQGKKGGKYTLTASGNKEYIKQ